MKLRLLLPFLLLAGSLNTALAQKELPVFDKNVPVTWLGLDFSKARFSGDYYKFNTVEGPKKLMLDLNNLMGNEKDKFNVSKILWRRSDKVFFRLNVTEDHNSALDVAALLADSLASPMHLQTEDIEDIVKAYDYQKNKGLGLMFIIESFDKNKPIAYIWVTFVDMDTKELVMTRRMSKIPGGFGLRNYWSGSIDRLMISVKTKEYDLWRDQVLKKGK